MVGSCPDVVHSEWFLSVRVERVLCDERSNSVQCEEPFGNDIQPNEIPSNERISENPVLVNTTEKVTLPKFSIRVFGSVSVLGSQIADHFSTFYQPPAEGLDGSEILRRRTNYDLINIDIGRLLDGVGNSASDGLGRNSPSLV